MRNNDNEDPLELYLSGGGLRAGLCAVGCIGYLEQSGQWGRVEHVISVSGGSLINGAIVTDRLGDIDDTKIDKPGIEEVNNPALVRSLAQFVTRLTSRSNHPLFGLRGMLNALMAIVLLASMIALLLYLSGAVGSFPFASTPTAIAAGIVFFPASLTIVRWWAARLMRDVGRVAAGSRAATGQSLEKKPNHVICASALPSNQPVFFTWPLADGETTVAPERDADFGLFPSEHPTALAITASASVPFTSGVTLDLHRAPNQHIVDAGWAGKFGDQWRGGVYGSSASRGEFLALDAGTHSKRTKKSTLLGRFSVIWRLNQWLEASNESVYNNDLQDLQRGLVRACRHDPMTPEGNQGLDEALNDMRGATSAVRNLGVTPEKAALAIATGFLSTAQHFDEYEWLDTAESFDAAEQALIKFGRSLDAYRESDEGSGGNWSLLLPQALETHRRQGTS